MEKEFVPYELALELKQLGFDEPCLAVTHKDGSLMFMTHQMTKDEQSDYLPTITNSECMWEDDDGGIQEVATPTYSSAFRWFREKYDIHYSINRECSQHDHKWGYNWSLYNYTGTFDEYLTSHPDAPAGEWVYETHEEAELACLRKLIETVKEK